MLDSELFTGFFGITSNPKESGKRLCINHLTSTGFSAQVQNPVFYVLGEAGFHAANHAQLNAICGVCEAQCTGEAGHIKTNLARLSCQPRPE